MKKECLYSTKKANMSDVVTLAEYVPTRHIDYVSDYRVRYINAKERRTSKLLKK